MQNFLHTSNLWAVEWLWIILGKSLSLYLVKLGVLARSCHQLSVTATLNDHPILHAARNDSVRKLRAIGRKFNQLTLSDQQIW